MADSGVAKIVAATALISFVSAPNPVIRPQPPAMREAASLSSGDGVVTGCHGPWLALGDTLQCHPARRWCTRNGDACSDSPFRREADLASLRWVSSDESVLRVSNGRIEAVGTGHARVAVFLGDTTDDTEFTVLPPVAAIRFERPLYTMRVGDTVRIRAWAYDSTGKPVQFLLPEGYLVSKNSARVRQVWTRDRATAGDLILATGVGQTSTVITLAHRSDITRITVIP